MLRKGKPASFRLFPVGADVVVYSAGSFLPTLVGLLKANTLVRLPSCVLRSLDAFHECFGFGLTQCRRPTWVARRVWRADFRLQPRPALEGGPLRLTHKRTDQEHRQARGEAPGDLSEASPVPSGEPVTGGITPSLSG